MVNENQVIDDELTYRRNKAKLTLLAWLLGITLAGIIVCVILGVLKAAFDICIIVGCVCLILAFVFIVLYNNIKFRIHRAELNRQLRKTEKKSEADKTDF